MRETLPIVVCVLIVGCVWMDTMVVFRWAFSDNWLIEKRYLVLLVVFGKGAGRLFPFRACFLWAALLTTVILVFCLGLDISSSASLFDILARSLIFVNLL